MKSQDEPEMKRRKLETTREPCKTLSNDVWQLILSYVTPEVLFSSIQLTGKFFNELLHFTPALDSAEVTRHCDSDGFWVEYMNRILSNHYYPCTKKKRNKRSAAENNENEAHDYDDDIDDDDDNGYDSVKDDTARLSPELAYLDATHELLEYETYLRQSMTQEKSTLSKSVRDNLEKREWSIFSEQFEKHKKRVLFWDEQRMNVLLDRMSVSSKEAFLLDQSMENYEEDDRRVDPIVRNHRLTFAQEFKRQYLLFKFQTKQLTSGRLELSEEKMDEYRELRSKLPPDERASFSALEKEKDKCLQNSTSLQEFVVGYWGEEAREKPNSFKNRILDWLVENQDAFPRLQSLFLADVSYTFCEVSWMHVGDITPVLENYQQLLFLRSKGMNGLRLSPIEHHNLLSLTFITGGFSTKIFSSLLWSSFSNLMHLEIWFGSNNYGFTVKDEQLRELLSPEEKGLFPRLEYLGLRNHEAIDQFVGDILKSAIAKRVRIIDLSLGTFSDKGAQEMLTLFNEDETLLPQFDVLEMLDVHQSFLSDSMVDQLQKLPFLVCCVHNRLNPARDYRYVSLSE